MSYYLLEPVVAGGLAENTVMDTSTHPPRVQHLRYAIDDWHGDELLESTPAFVIAERLADDLTARNDLNGYRLAEAEVTLSDTGVELLADATLPAFRWLQITGAPGQDDFGLTGNADLVVSARALELLQSGNLENCDIGPWTGH